MPDESIQIQQGRKEGTAGYFSFFALLGMGSDPEPSLQGLRSHQDPWVCISPVLKEPLKSQPAETAGPETESPKGPMFHKPQSQARS